MEKLNVGIVGTGYMGMNHLRVYSELKDCEVVGVVDASQEALENVKSKFNVNTYNDLDKFIKENKLDAVSVAVPTSLHYEISKKLIENDINVLVEKPFTNKIEHAQELIDLAKKNNVKLMVGYIERFNPVIQSIKAILSSGMKSNVFHSSIFRLNPQNRSNDSAIFDLCTHDIDLSTYLLESEVKDVIATAFLQNNVEKHIVAILKFENGKQVLIESSLLYPIKIREIQISAPDTLIHGNLFTNELTIHRKKRSYVEDYFGKIEYETFKPTLQKVEPLRQEISHFLECVKHDKTPMVTGEDALKTLKVAFEIQKKTKEGV